MKLKKVIFPSFIIALLTLSLYISYQKELKNLPSIFLDVLTKSFQKENTSFYKIDFVDLYIKSLKKNDSHFKINNSLNEDLSQVNKVLYNTEEPLFYIYNTHSSEEYSYTKNDVYNIVPNVKTASYILEEELKKLGISSFVESENTIDILNSKNMAYSMAYEVSRDLLETRRSEYDTITYFIDLHRDSVKREATTTTIDGVSYAKVMFLLGLENPNYQENKKVLTKLNDYLNENYKGLSRGIYEKQGAGVNGVYNQDISPNVILIEVGGVDNTIEEVSNSLKVVSNCLYNYLNSLKTTKTE